MSLEDIYNHFTIPRDVKKVNSSPYMSSVINRIKKQETEFNEKLKKNIEYMIDTVIQLLNIYLNFKILTEYTYLLISNLL